jgi:hypothetical protein
MRCRPLTALFGYFAISAPVRTGLRFFVLYREQLDEWLMPSLVQLFGIASAFSSSMNSMM